MIKIVIKATLLPFLIGGWIIYLCAKGVAACVEASSRRSVASWPA